jgi:hypothetical protein
MQICIPEGSNYTRKRGSKNRINPQGDLKTPYLDLVLGL